MRILWKGVPSVLDASTYSLDLRRSTCARTMRLMLTQPVMARAMQIVGMPGFITSSSNIMMIRLGMPVRISTKRCMAKSTLPA